MMSKLLLALVCALIVACQSPAPALIEKVRVLEIRLDTLAEGYDEIYERQRSMDWKLGLVLPACDGEWLWASMCVAWPEEFSQPPYEVPEIFQELQKDEEISP